MIEYSVKYLTDRIIWYKVNTFMPQTDKQHFMNAENFLAAQAAKKIVEQVIDYMKKLSADEINFIEAIAKLTK